MELLGSIVATFLKVLNAEPSLKCHCPDFAVSRMTVLQEVFSQYCFKLALLGLKRFFLPEPSLKAQFLPCHALKLDTSN